MKKLLIIVLCALLCASPVLAESGNSFSLFPTPVPGEEAPGHEEEPSEEAPFSASSENYLNLILPDVSMTLDFDDDPQYSLREGGYVQASFFAYDAEDVLYEVYLIFPENVETGSIVNPHASAQNNDDESCVLMYISTETSEIYAAAGQMDGAAYPEGADYAIRFTEVSRSGSAFTFAGTVSATLVSLDENYNPIDLIDGFSGSFRFTMDYSAPSLPGGDAEPAAPVIPQAPAFLVTPPDAQKI